MDDLHKKWHKRKKPKISDEKEREYQSEEVTPFIDFELFDQLKSQVAKKKLWEITEEDIKRAENTMLEYAKAHS